MARMLKCPDCKSQSAYKQWGFNQTLGKRYRNKRCSVCGHETAKHYYGEAITYEEYLAENERIRASIAERLAEKEEVNK